LRARGNLGFLVTGSFVERNDLVVLVVRTYANLTNTSLTTEAEELATLSRETPAIKLVVASATPRNLLLLTHPLE